jgi:methionyl-tRNA formyltransferase
MRLEILKDGHPVLRQKAKPVKQINASVKRLLDDMVETLYEAPGIGLAAPQVGVSKRVIVVDCGEGLYEIVNPETLSRDGAEVSFEGCLSIPGWVGEVERAASIRVTGLNRDGRQVWIDGSGLLARVLQHEMDHLDGVLFKDKAISLTEATAEDEEEEDEPEHLPLRIVYMGTPEFAVPSLEALVDEEHDVLLVVTQPDRRGNRGRITVPPVKEVAQELGLRVAQPEDVGTTAFIEQVAALQPDFIVVAAFGQKLPPSLLDVPKYGAINVHASLLPEYRGAAPVQRAILDGKTETGVTIMQMAAALDAGDILAQEAVPIGADEDTEMVLARVAVAGAQLLPRVLLELVNGNVKPRVQEEGKVTWAKSIKKRDERINWKEPAERIVNRVRALSPAPGAVTSLHGKALKLFAAKVIEGDAPALPGTLVSVSGNPVVSAGDGLVELVVVQPAGKKRMTGEEFTRGYRPEKGARFDDHWEG